MEHNRKSEIDPHKYTSPIFTKMQRKFTGESILSFSNRILGLLDVCMQKYDVSHILYKN